MPDDNNAKRILPSYVDAQEERLQHVEQQSAEQAVQIARVEQGLVHTVENVNAGFKFLGDKIDSIVRPLAEAQHEAAQRIEALGDRVGAQAAGLQGLQEESKRRRERWSTVAKYVVPIMTGAAAIGLKELVVFLARH